MNWHLYYMIVEILEIHQIFKNQKKFHLNKNIIALD
jgi:hypothetical protein